jgi:transposase
MDETAVCVVDDKGKVALKVSVVTDPEAIKIALKPYPSRLQ